MKLPLKSRNRAVRKHRPRFDQLEDRILLSATRVSDDLQALYLFEEGAGSTVMDVSGVGTPLDLEIDTPANTNWQTGSLEVVSPARITSSGPATKVIDAVLASEEITVEAWVTPANTTQTGPARIAGVSLGTTPVNFGLGQNKTRYDAKFRTTNTNTNGNPPTLTPGGVANTGLTHVVYTRDAGGQASLYVDAVLSASRTTSGTLSNWDAGYLFGIANTTNGTKPWLGTLDLVAVYSAALTPGEVTQNFDAGPDPDSGPSTPSADIVDVTPDPRSTSVGDVRIDFSEPVTGVDIADFRLTLDGSLVDLSGLSVTEVSLDEYTIDLSSVTNTQGSYELTLVAAGSGIASLNSISLASDATDAFDILFSAPVADILDVTPDPSSTSVGDVRIDFSEPVTGVDIADFSLEVDGNALDLTGLAITEVSADEYTLDLSTVTTTDGNYVLTLVATGSGIESLNSVLLAADATDSFAISFPVPTADIVDVSPDPSSSPIGVVTIDFSEPVSGVDIADFTLEVDGSFVDLSGLTVTEVSAEQYTIDLSTVTAAEGSYVLTLVAAGAGISNPSGQLVIDDAQDSFVVDQTSPTSGIADIPTGSSVSNATVTFDEDVTGVDASDFGLTRDGTNIGLAGLAVTTVNAAQYTLDLSPFTSTPGGYVLTLTAASSAIEDTAGNPLAADAVESFTVTAPPVSSRVTDDLQVLYTFTAGSGSTVFDVSGVGSPLDLQIGSPANVTWQSGAIDVDSGTVIESSGPATKVIDAVTGSGEITVEAWVTPANTTQTGPARIAGVSLGTTPVNFGLGQNKTRYDAKFRTTNTNTNGNPPTLTPGGVANTGLTHVVYTRDAGGQASLYVDAVLSASRTTSGTLSNWDAGYLFGIANTTNGTKPWLGTLDLVAVYSAALTPGEVTQNFDAGPDPDSGPSTPSADIVDVTPDPRSTSVGDVRIDFSEPVTGVDIADFRLTLDGSLVDLSGLSVTEVSLDEYTIDLSSVTNTQGSYELTLVAAGSGIASLNSISLASDATDAFDILFSAPVADILDVTPDPSSTSVGDVRIDFSEPVTGVDIADFSLEVDGNALDLTGLAITEVSADEYTLDLSTVTTTDGNYVLTLVATGSGIESLNSVLLAADATDSFAISFPVPTADIVDVSPDPSSSPIGVVTIDFSEPVSGVDIADFTLEVDGSFVDLSGLTVTEVSAEQYTIDLSTVTVTEGGYVLTLVAAGSGIAGFVPMVADATDAFAVDLTLPTAAIASIPDGEAPVGDVVITFDEDVVGVDAADFELTRDGNAVALTGLTVVADSPSEYTLDLSPFADVAGVYELALLATASGISDTAGNLLAADASESFSLIQSTILRVDEDLQVLYTFDATSGSTVFDVSGTGTALDLQIDDLSNVTRQAGSIDVNSSARISSAGPATKVINAVKASREITIEAWITPANTTQTGPARIVGVSDGSFSANFNLGQNLTRYDAKLRTTSTNLTGNPSTATPAGTVATTLTHVVYTRTSNRAARLYVDGVLTASRTTGGTMSNWNASYPLAIANTMNDTKPWLGKLDLVAVYSKALSESEVLQNFDAGPDPDGPPPSADIVDVSPDPSTIPVNEVTVTFDEAVTGVDIGDFTLTQDGNPVDISLLSVVEVAPDEYTIDLKTVTDEDGSYELTLVAAGSQIANGNGVFLAADAIDTFDVDVVDTPIRTRIADMASNGNPIFEFYTDVPDLQVLTHDGSGDTQSISADGRYLALYVTEDFNLGDWYAYEFETGILTLIGERIPGNPPAGLNFRFMWGPNGNDFMLIEPATGGGSELVSKNVAGTVNWTTPLPSTLPGPDAFNDGNAPVSVAWRGGEAAGEVNQFLGALAFVNNQSYLWVQPFDATAGAFLPGTGFWVVDNSGGIGTTCHNCWSGLGGIVYTPVSPTNQGILYWASYDGSQFIQLEPDELPLLTDFWFHQSYDGDDVLYATVGGEWTYIEEYTNGPTGPDNDGDGVPDRTTIMAINHADLLQFFPGVTNPYQVSYWHGHLNNRKAVVSVIIYNDSLDPTDDEFILILVDANTNSMSLILDAQQYNNDGPAFYSQPRPTISFAHDRACWHSADEDDNTTTLCIDV